MKTIVEILRTNNNKIFAQLINKNHDLESLTRIFRNAVDPEAAKNCRLASVDNRVLHLAVKNAAWASRMRYQLPELLKNLRTQPEFHTITSIKYFVERQFTAPSTKRSAAHQMSPHNEAMWRQTIAKLRQSSCSA